MTPSVLVIYTGGTIGMVMDPITKALAPFNFDALLESVPGLDNLGVDIDTYCFEHIIDSSDMNPDYWVKIAEQIEKNYDKYDGFVVLHGTDTMSYSASALSFMLEGLQKPVILTGSQLPLGILRSDGKDNLINSIEIAAAKNDKGLPMVPEVCICFENTLYRGNRTTKINAENFNAFYSGNYPALAEIGIHIKYQDHLILHRNANKLTVHKQVNPHVLILKIYPGISQEVVEHLLNTPKIKGVILETYGSGNAPTSEWLSTALKNAVARGLIILNVTQCKAGAVEMGKYQASVELLEAGVISGHDITTESAVCKMMLLCGENRSNEDIKEQLQTAVCGEITINY